MTATKALHCGPQPRRCSRCGEADDFGTLIEVTFQQPGWRNVESKLICGRVYGASDTALRRLLRSFGLGS